MYLLAFITTGWCIFNDLAVAGKAVQRDADVGQLLMLDLDVHQGDGSATIFAGRPDSQSKLL